MSDESLNLLAFFDRVRRVCARIGVSVRLVPGEYIDGGAAGGLYEDDDKTITVAIGRSDWLETLAHEYGHALQAAQGVFVGPDMDEAYGFDSWLDGKTDADAETVERWVRLVQACELDAEKRAVAFIVEEAIREDVDTYVRSANAYVLAYEAARQTRKWVKGFARDPAAMALMPSTFVEDVSSVPPAFLDLYRQRCA